MQCGSILGHQLDLSLMDHQIKNLTQLQLWLKYNYKSTDIICVTADIRITPIYNLENPLRFNLKVCNFKNFLGRVALPPSNSMLAVPSTVF